MRRSARSAPHDIPHCARSAVHVVQADPAVASAASNQVGNLAERIFSRATRNHDLEASKPFIAATRKGSEAKTYVTEYGQDMGYTNGQDMGYSFEQSSGCQRTAKERYFGVS